MKTIALSLMLGMMMPALQFSDLVSYRKAVAVAAGASFNWEQTTYDFGSIKQNKPVTHEFKFTNNGGEVLVISTVQASCGCTVTEYTKDPVPPGATGYVKATYNAAHTGAFNKTVTINANTEKPVVVLTIKGVVE